MLAAALWRYAPTWLESLLAEFTHWLASNEYASIAQLKGSMSLRNYSDASAYHRSNYMKAVTSYTSHLI